MKKQLKLPSLSLFFPAYNEAGNIEEAVRQALAVLPLVAKKYEIIVINDGSQDATGPIVERLANHYKTVRLVNQRNKGYGGALKRGFKEAKYDWIFFTDSDLQFNLQELKKLVQVAVAQDLHMVLGYRTNRAEGLKRALLARALKIWNRVLLGFPRKIKDIDCAFKLIRKDVIHTIEPLFSDGAMVSTELLLKAHQAQIDYAQVGVKHYKRQHGKPTGNSISVIFTAVRDTLLLKKSLTASKISSYGLQTAQFVRSFVAGFSV